MNPHRATNRLDKPLHQPHARLGTSSFCHFQTDKALEIDIDMTNGPYAIIINLGHCSNNYVLNGAVATLHKGCFNIFYVPGGSLRWVFKDGENHLVVLKYKQAALTMFLEEHELIKGFVNPADPAKASVLNAASHLITPVMRADIDKLLEYSFGDDRLRTLHRQTSAVTLLYNTLDACRMYHEGTIDNDTVIELKGIYTYMIENLAGIQDADQLMAMSDLPEKRLQEVFRVIYHCPLPDALHKERLKRSEDLVRFTDYPVEEMALAVGFAGAAEFAEAFEFRYGMLPEKFREVHGG